MKIPIFYLDAFTNKQFKGNQIAVCVLEKCFLDKQVMQNIATEINFSETAFVYSDNNDFSKDNNFYLKWFTPTNEVNLCGHGTLGTSYLIFNCFNNTNQEISFNTLSGNLKAKKEQEYIWLDFPIRNFSEYKIDKEILEALNIDSYINSVISKESQTLLIELNNISEIKPDFENLAKINIQNIEAVIITEKSNDIYDFKSRYFTPWHGINEDPVTGSAHCLLSNYWSNKLNKNEMLAYQNSKRGGELKLIINKESNRVLIGGEAVMTLKGELCLI